jgi:transposase
MGKVFRMTEKELSRYDLMIRIKERTLSQVNAAELLGISDRHFRRLLKQYQEFGIEGITSKRRGGNNRYKIGEKEAVLALIKDRYANCGPTFVYEKLREEHEVRASKETIRNWMIEAGLWEQKKRKRLRLHQSRSRRSHFGELIQMDGSPHDWFEGRRDKCCLLGFIDDATSRIMHLKFTESETTEAYFSSIQEYFEEHGMPENFYSDRFSVFRVNNDKSGYRGLGLTQLGRALKEVDVGLICANSPQAKGRIERLFGTLQDRLVKEMRLRQISTLEEANAFLPEYIRSHNAKYSVEAANSEDRHRAVAHDLDAIFCYKSTRKLSKNLELSYETRILQIETDNPSYAMRGAQVEIRESLDGEIEIWYQGRSLSYRELLVKDHQGRVLNRKNLSGGAIPDAA